MTVALNQPLDLKSLKGLLKYRYSGIYHWASSWASLVRPKDLQFQQFLTSTDVNCLRGVLVGAVTNGLHAVIVWQGYNKARGFLKEVGCRYATLCCLCLCFWPPLGKSRTNTERGQKHTSAFERVQALWPSKIGHWDARDMAQKLLFRRTQVGIP